MTMLTYIWLDCRQNLHVFYHVHVHGRSIVYTTIEAYYACNIYEFINWLSKDAICMCIYVVCNHRCNDRSIVFTTIEAYYACNIYEYINWLSKDFTVLLPDTPYSEWL